MAATGPRKARRENIECALGLRYLEAGSPPDGVLVTVKEVTELLGDGTPRNSVSSAMVRLCQLRPAPVKSVPQYGRGAYLVFSDFGQNEGLGKDKQLILPVPPPHGDHRGAHKVAALKFMRENPGPHDFRELIRAGCGKDAHMWLKQLAGEGVIRRVSEDRKSVV